MKVHVNIEIDTSIPEQAQLLALLAGATSPEADPSPQEAPAKKAPAKKAPAKKASPAKPESDQFDEDLLSAAIDAATALMKAGKAEKVKGALADMGVERVTMLKTNEQVSEFLAQITD